MRHLRSGRKLNRTASHRKAMLKNLAVSILEQERVTTTIAKAKEVRSVVERLITYGKKGDLHGIRLAEKSVKSKDVLKKLFNDIAPAYKDREGGYTRIIRLNDRKGDNAEMAIIELVGRDGDEQRAKKKKKKAAGKTKTTQKTQPKIAEATEKSTEEEVKENAGGDEKVQEKKRPTKAKGKTVSKTAKKETNTKSTKEEEIENTDNKDSENKEGEKESETNKKTTDE